MRATLERPPAGSAGLETGAAPDGSGPGILEGGVQLPRLTVEQAIWLGIIAAAFLMRILGVGDRAMHHDESMHAFYSWQLFKGDGYQYNPLLHGPFQFHAMALMYFLFGVSETSARLTAVVCGTIIVGAIWFLRPYLGKLGAIFAAALFAISPSFLYFSRFAREDIYVACFTLLMAVGMFGWLHTRRPRWIYLLFTATGLAFATKESTFITLFIFGTFVLGVLGLEAFGFRPGSEASVPKSRDAEDDEEDDERETSRFGMVTESLLAVPRGVWVTGVVCFAAVTVLLYTTFLTNNHGLIDAFSSSLKYWLAQQGVRRGDQPGYYYALLLPAYEQIPVLFGVIAMVRYVYRWWFVPVVLVAALGIRALALEAPNFTTPTVAILALALGVTTIYLGVTRGRLFSAFLTYWGVMAFIIYSWAGEKMPWLSLHVVMPFILLAGLVLGELLGARRPWTNWRWAAAIAAGFLAVFTIHADWPLNYYRGDVPQDMLIYTQTSPQVKTAVAQINQLSDQLTHGKDIKVLIDNNATWPFAWYLRDYKNIGYTGPLTSPPDQPVVITSPEDDAADKAQLTNYVGNSYVLRWWFPEDYRGLTLDKVKQTLTDPAMRKTLWNWLTLRETPSPLGTYGFTLWIRKDLAGGMASNLDFVQQQAAAPAAPAAQGADPFAGRTTKIASSQTIGSSGAGDGQFNGARGVAIAPDGSIYVADQGNNRVEKFDAAGKFVLKWGSKGKGDGQFDTPSGIALDKSGNVWVSDLWNHRVQEFDASGKFLTKFGTNAAATGAESPGGFFGPRGVAIGPNGDVYVTDTGNKRVQKFTSAGKFEMMWGQPGTGPGQFEEPIGITVDAQGNVYVADTWNRRVQVFDAGGSFQRQISVGSWPSAQTTYGEPFVAVQPNGDVIVTDPLRSRVLAFNPGGSLVSAWGGAGSDPSSMSAPTGIAISPAGQIVVSDTINGRLLVFPQVSQ